MRLHPTAITPLVVMLLACGADDPASPDTTPSDTPDASSDADAPDLGGCTPITPADLGPLVFDRQDDVSTSYSMALALDLGVPAADYLVLQFFNYNERIDAATGNFALDVAPNDDFGTCPECVAIWVDQADPSLPPGKYLFQSSGTLRLDVDPRSRRLIGRLEGVRFSEIELDPMTLSSTFVPDGECAVLTEPLDFDLRWIPPEWTCAPASYHTDDGCDCDCGASDPDCYPPPLETSLLVASSDCADGELCAYDRCVALCSLGFGSAEAKACEAGEVCTIELPDDVCRADEPVDPANLGEACSGMAMYCAMGAGGLAAGLCSFDTERTCRPLCGSRGDCGPEQRCYIVRGDARAEEGKGYCTDGAPATWYCEAGQWGDGATCHCGCGDADPDCADPALPVEGCDGARCGADGACP